MKKVCLKTALTALVLATSSLVSFANAGIVTFTDRDLFEAYVNNVIVDGLETVEGMLINGTRQTTNSNDFFI